MIVDQPAPPDLAALIEHASSRGHDRRRIQRFLAKIRFSQDGCWIWNASIKPNGYGQFQMGRKTDVGNRSSDPAHRVSYSFFVGEIPEGLQIDHLCRVPLCVNPSHLEVVTQRENILRGESISAQYARETHCKRGHEKTPENTLYYKGRPVQCKLCRRITARIRWPIVRLKRQKRGNHDRPSGTA